MSKITLITGSQETFKTTMARSLTDGAKPYCVYADRLSSTFPLQGLDESYGYLVIDDVVDPKSLKGIIDVERLKIDHQGRWPTEIKRPNLIIISQSLTPKDFPGIAMTHIHITKEQIPVNQ